MQNKLFIIWLIIFCFFALAGLDFIYTKAIIQPLEEKHVQIEKNYRVQNDIFGHSLEPLYEGPASWGGHLYQLATNSLGFKDATSRVVEKNPERRRVVFIGDSFTEAVGLPSGKTFVGRVAAERQDLEVLNAGVMGFSPSNYYRKIKWLLEAEYEIHSLWVFIDVSDIQDEANAFDEDEKGQPLIKKNLSLQNIETPFLKDLSVTLRKWAYSAKSGAKKNFYLLFNFGKKLLKLGIKIFRNMGLLPDGYNENMIYWWVYDPRPNWPKMPNDLAYQPLGVERSIEKAKFNMTRLFKLVQKHGIELSVAVYPWPTQIYHGDFKSRYVRIWEDWCNNKCENFLNLFPVFFSKAEKYGAGFYEQLFIINDVHFNEWGNEIIAQALLERKLP